MSWIFITILSYFFFAVTAIIDKFLLTGPIQSPKVYSFYVGTLGVLVFLLIPFVDFSIPALPLIVLSFTAGIFSIIALFWLYKGLHSFDASRIVPAIGGLIPIFSFGLIFLFSAGKETLSFIEIIAFLFLILGTVLITLKKEKLITLKSFKFAVLAAFFFALYFVLAKYVYMSQSFWSGLILIRIGGVFVGLVLLFSKEVRDSVFSAKPPSFKKKASLKTPALFLFNQGLGSLGAILQNFALFLVPLSFVSLVGALQGVQYVFLLILSVFLSLKFPQILKEEISRKVLSQKIIATLFIIIGLLILAYNNGLY